MSLTISLPQLNHPEVSAFYEYDLSISREKVEAILGLPRETLIQDLENLLLDAIERHDSFQNYEDQDKWWEFPTHALYMLVELKATTSLPTILKLLQQEEGFTGYWFGDAITEDFWQGLYHLGEGSFSMFKDLILQPGDWVNRIVPSTALVQIALHQPEKKTEIITWYDEILEAFLAMEEGSPALDNEVISSIVGDLIELQAIELLPKIKILCDEGLVSKGITGDYASIEKDIHDKEYNYGKREVAGSIFDRYTEVMGWHGYRMRYDEAYKKKNTYSAPKIVESSTSSEDFSNKAADYYSSSNSIVPVRTEKKIGRNEPCPCGSGKKHKKCCLKK